MLSIGLTTLQRQAGPVRYTRISRLEGAVGATNCDFHSFLDRFEVFQLIVANTILFFLSDDSELFASSSSVNYT